MLDRQKKIIEGEWALPEFEVLKDLQWDWSEKIDGTNVRILWNGAFVRFGGKTDDAQIHTALLRSLQDIFTKEKMATVFGSGDPMEVCLYGEGYGSKIQKGGNYMPDYTGFILFDCKKDTWWLEKNNTIDIANKLGIPHVPIIKSGTLLEAVEFVKKGFVSTIAHNKNYMAEGLIMKPPVTLFNRKGERIVAKIKHKDFSR